MMRSWNIGSAFGINIYIHWSVLLLLGLFLYQIDPPALAVLILGAILGSVVLHELGHALMARYFGIGTRDITLYVIGGVARLEKMTERPHEELWIALAGPAVNVVIALVLLPFVPWRFILGTAGSPDSLSLGMNLVLSVLALNIALVAFNMLPAFPMDGGRVFRALLSMAVGHRRATETAAALGAGMAMLLGLIGAASAVGLTKIGSPMLLVVAGFVYLAGQQELVFVRQQARLSRLAPIDVLPADDDIPSVVPVDVEPGFSGLVWDDRHRVWIVWQNGRPLHSPRMY